MCNMLIFVGSRGWFLLISSGVKQISSHLVVCPHSDLSYLRFLFQVNAGQLFKLPFKKLNYILKIIPVFDLISIYYFPVLNNSGDSL